MTVSTKPPDRDLLKPGLEVSDLRVDYGAFTAVHGISFSIEPGTIFGLVGPNGAGKTSAIKVLATLLQPTYGEVKLEGEDLIDHPERVHANIGYMPDLAPVIPDLRVWEFIDLFASAYGWPASTRKARVEACLKQVEMWESRDTFGKNLSRGMTQRVVLAKTLLPNPKLLLLDEPASGMDPLARIQLKVILQELASRGAMVLISSHILTELADMCTDVGIMHQGHMRYVGPIGDVGNANTTGIPVRVVLMQLISGYPELSEDTFTQFPQIVQSRRKDASRWELTVEGGEEAQVTLLRNLIDAGLPIASFQQQSSLENALQSIARPV